jgi:hypothetical protein
VVTTKEDVEEARADRPRGARPAVARRVRIAQALAMVGLVAAVVAAMGPSERVRSTYSWPPRALPADAPSRVWYSPLLFAARVPETLSARIPCSVPEALPNADNPVSVLATARSPTRIGGLSVTSNAGRLTVRVGDTVLARLPRTSPADGEASCAHELRIESGRWSIDGGPSGRSRSDDLGFMPVVTGVFSEVDLHSAPAPSVEITTRTHMTRATTRQVVGWLVAAVASLLSLALVAFRSRPRARRVFQGVARSGLRRGHVADAVVVLVLLVWWVVAPAFWDDGWIVARQDAFSGSGGFSNYYNGLAANLPNGYWLEWIQHWLTERSRSLVALRIPALLSLVTIWVLCRWSLLRVAGQAAGMTGTPVWALAFGFLTCALAWGMTLRPEPFVALIVMAIFTATVRFLERGSVAPLALIALFVPLAATAHHTGVVAVAPLIAIAPRLFAFARSHVAVATTLGATAIALVTLLAFVGSDVASRANDAQVTRSFGDVPQTWRDEFDRYALLTDFPYGAPLRRSSVALIGFALLAFMLRRRRRAGRLVDLPSVTLAVSLLLLIATPSKWPWHFGALIGFTALAVASESWLLSERTDRRRATTVPPLLLVGATTIAAAWSWTPRIPWSAVDLRTLEWELGVEEVLPLSTLAIALPILVLLGLTLLHRGQAREIPYRVAALSVPILTVPLLLFTLSVLVLDASKTKSWTLARQNLGSIRGDGGCGIADDLIVPVRISMQPISRSSNAPSNEPRWLPPAPIDGIDRFALGPTGSEYVETPWFALPPEAPVGLFVSGKPGTSDVVELEWGRPHGKLTELLRSSRIPVGFAHETGSSIPWRFVSARELPARPRAATLARVRIRSDSAEPATVGITAPVTYETSKLSAELGIAGSRPLVMPSLLTYFPCADLPQMRDGIVEAPTHIVVRSTASSPIEFTRTSPFRGVLDLYSLERLPFADSENPPKDFVVFGVDKGVPGGVVVPPDRLTRIS